MAGHYPALVLELVDKRDLKSLGQKCPYGFDPRPEHDKNGGDPKVKDRLKGHLSFL